MLLVVLRHHVMRQGILLLPESHVIRALRVHDDDYLARCKGCVYSVQQRLQLC